MSEITEASSPVLPPDRPTTAERLAQIKARVERATPKKWLIGSFNGKPAICGPDWFVVCAFVDGDSQSNASFIAAARSDVPFLLERIEELERELENYREKAAALHRYMSAKPPKMGAAVAVITELTLLVDA